MWPLSGLRCEAGWLKSQLIAALCAGFDGEIATVAGNGSVAIYCFMTGRCNGRPIGAYGPTRRTVPVEICTIR